MNTLDAVLVADAPRERSAPARALRERDRQTIAAIVDATRRDLAPRDPGAVEPPAIDAVPLVVPGLAALLCGSILLIWSTVL